MKIHTLPLRGILAAVLMIASSAAVAEDWSRFRGPNGSGISNDAGYPAEFGPSKNVAWRTPVRSGKSSPVLTDHHVYLTAFENGSLFTQCIDRVSGRLLWERSEPRSRAEFGNVRNEPAAMTPVTDGINVYAFFPDFGVLSYDPAGNVRWKTRLGPFTNTMGLASSPILAGDFVIVVADQQDDSFLAALDRLKGEITGKRPAPKKTAGRRLSSTAARVRVIGS